MTGRELIAVLSQLTDAELDREIETEGCDCWGDVVQVSTPERNGSRTVTLIRRSDHLTAYIPHGLPDYDEELARLKAAIPKMVRK